MRRGDGHTMKTIRVHDYIGEHNVCLDAVLICNHYLGSFCHRLTYS